MCIGMDFPSSFLRVKDLNYPEMIQAAKREAAGIKRNLHRRGKTARAKQETAAKISYSSQRFDPGPFTAKRSRQVLRRVLAEAQLELFE